jgi:hypothetical protein
MAGSHVHRIDAATPPWVAPPFHVRGAASLLRTGRMAIPGIGQEPSVVS